MTETKTNDRESHSIDRNKIERAIALCLSRSPQAEEIYILWSVWARWDRRLAYALVQNLFIHWWRLNPIQFNLLIRADRNNTAILPLFEFIKVKLEMDINNNTGLSLHHKERMQVFELYFKICCRGVQKNEKSFFFHSKQPKGFVQVSLQVKNSDPLFEKWGYFEKQRLVEKRQSLVWSKAARVEAITKLKSSFDAFTVNDYLEKINFCISRRQAERDLEQDSDLVRRGKTQASYYILRKSKRAIRLR